MNIIPTSSIDINNLIGALLINENGHEFYCTKIKFSLDCHDIWLDLSEERGGPYFASLSFSNLDNWSIQF
jgi:hypothetical protein